ncbi:MAG: hypothetical protein ACLTR5_06830 [Oscillospiraceae bacterium]
MNLTNLADIRALLARHDFRFSKSLGQNFLTAAWVPADIADASGADEHIPACSRSAPASAA